MRTQRFSQCVQASGSFRLLLAAAVGMLFIGHPCWAHKVNVFAYVEGDKIVVEGYFSKDRKAINCAVQFFDAGGKEIHGGKTDKNGRYVVPIADLGTLDGDILITLSAGEGHKRDYRLRADEIPKPSGPSPGTAPSGAPVPASESRGASEPTKPETLDQERKTLEEVIEAIVQRENQKIMQMLGNQQRLLLEERNSGPSLQEVVGGIGWIVGIVGIIAFFMSRKGNR
ncbi:MAG: hypothetical protein RDU20_01965 [Desulfomonilaceae bacterium]|nr:hypothetical protein [Desulfomonilaceae bacterium]